MSKSQLLIFAPSGVNASHQLVLVEGLYEVVVRPHHLALALGALSSDYADRRLPTLFDQCQLRFCGADAGQDPVEIG